MESGGILVLVLLLLAILHFRSEKRDDAARKEREQKRQLDDLNASIARLEREKQSLIREKETLRQRMERVRENVADFTGDALEKLHELRAFKPACTPSEERLFLLAPGRLMEMSEWVQRASLLQEQLESLSPASRRLFEEECLSSLTAPPSAGLEITPLMAEAISLHRTVPAELGLEVFGSEAWEYRQLASWLDSLADVSKGQILRAWNFKHLSALLDFDRSR